MEQLPKIARARMAGRPAGDHPEAEQLNAFAESALASDERESVLAHLAACATCREIVSLAAAARPEGVPLVKPALTGFRWATFQWAAVAASVAIVTVAVLVVGPKDTRVPQRATEVATIQPKPAQTPEVQAASNAHDETRKSDVNAEVKSQVANKRAVAGISGRSVKGVGSGGGFGGGVYRVQEDQKAANSDSLAKLPEKKETVLAEPAANATPSRDLAYRAPGHRDNDTFFSSAPVPSAKQPGQGSVRGGIEQSPPPSAVEDERARAEEQGKSSNELNKDKRPDAPTIASSESVQVTSRVAASPSPAFSQLHSKKAELAKTQTGEMSGGLVSTLENMRTWRLHSGKVQSSDDGGKIWQDHNPAQDIQPTKVVAVGLQVWVGGKAGALFLSRDNGRTWAKISLTGDDIIPLGDVSDIKIANPQHIDVLLSSGDDWQTSDGGKSFRLLPRIP